MATQYDIVHLASVESTQDAARERFRESGNATLVVAGAQTAGRGRQGREWTQPDLGAYSSVVFRTDWQMADRTLIPLVTAVAVSGALQVVCGVDAYLKWPNDLLLDGLKIGGILVEASDDEITVGCGINLVWESPVEGASSIFEDAPDSGVALALSQAWADRLFGYLELGSEAWPRDAYERRSVTIGRDVAWDGGDGVAVGIGTNGSLVVDTSDGSIELHAGEVHTRRNR